MFFKKNYMIRIERANEGKNFNKFIMFPHLLFKEDPYYVPQLNLVQKQLLSKKHNPFFKTAEAAYFIAVEDSGTIKGRIAAIYNKDHLKLYNDNTGFFGFFDCVNDVAVAKLLFKAASGWLKVKGIKYLVGPENPGTNDSVGILTSGYNKQPVFLMPYNFRYYKELIEKNGFEPVMKLYSYLFKERVLPSELNSRIQRIETQLGNMGISFRQMDFKNNFNRDVKGLQKVYNESNAGGWGFLPLDEKGFAYMAKDLRRLIKPYHAQIVEKNSEIIGYTVSVPDYNQVFKKISKGRLFPFGWYHLLTERKKINAIRAMILGVLPEYQELGIALCLYAKIVGLAGKNGIKWGEACYVMEDNRNMNIMMQKLGAEIIKEYQLFKLELY